MASEDDNFCCFHVKICALIVCLIGINVSGILFLLILYTVGPFSLVLGLPYIVLSLTYGFAMLGVLIRQPLILLFAMILLGTVWILNNFCLGWTILFTHLFNEGAGHITIYTLIPVTCGLLVGYIFFSMTVINDARLLFKYQQFLN